MLSPIIFKQSVEAIVNAPISSYCQFWCTKLKSSGDLVSLFHLFSIDELDAINDLGEVREAT